MLMSVEWNLLQHPGSISTNIIISLKYLYNVGGTFESQLNILKLGLRVYVFFSSYFCPKTDCEYPLEPRR